MAHPLDAAVFNALTTHQRAFAVGEGAALRFRADVSPIATTDAASAGALAALIAPGDDISLLAPQPPAPPARVEETLRAACLQMTFAKLPQNTPRIDFIELSDADAAEMLALALLTRPGPFYAKTHTLGRFIGVREKGRLIAMAGERLHLPGYREISAICTHPDHRGKGLGAALTCAVAARIFEDGEIPFLHCYASNKAAVSLYRALGFETRAEVLHAVWRRPA
ncbi:MAG: GNAT family N-acetyltransferase [Hyphomonadaceae bacterium]